MADGQSSVPVSPSGGRVVGCPHGYLCFVDAVDLVLRFLKNGQQPKMQPLYIRSPRWPDGGVSLPQKSEFFHCWPPWDFGPGATKSNPLKTSVF
jgi:hypothetical protein